MFCAKEIQSANKVKKAQSKLMMTQKVSKFL